jgi:hypothetical protein
MSNKAIQRSYDYFIKFLLRFLEKVISPTIFKIAKIGKKTQGI